MLKIGDKVAMQHSLSNGGTVQFKVTVVRIDKDGSIWVEFPAKVLAIPFPPNDGKRYAQYPATAFINCQ